MFAGDLHGIRLRLRRVIIIIVFLAPHILNELHDVALSSQCNPLLVLSEVL